MGSRPFVVGQTVSGLATISSLSANNSLVINMSVTPRMGQDYVVAKWKNSGAGTCGISLNDVLSGASYFAIAVAGGGSGSTSFVRPAGMVQGSISNISGAIVMNAWIDGTD